MANTTGASQDPKPTFGARLSRLGAGWIAAAAIAIGGLSACTLFYDADPGDPPPDAGSPDSTGGDDAGTGDGTGANGSRNG